MLSGTQTAFIGQLGLSTKQLHHIKILHTGLRCVRHSCQKIKYVNLCKGWWFSCFVNTSARHRDRVCWHRAEYHEVVSIESGEDMLVQLEQENSPLQLCGINQPRCTDGPAIMASLNRRGYVYHENIPVVDAPPTSHKTRSCIAVPSGEPVRYAE